MDKELIMSLFGKLLDSLGQNSTWRGLLQIATAVGIAIEPTQAAKIIAIGTAVVGAINVARKGTPGLGYKAPEDLTLPEK